MRWLAMVLGSWELFCVWWSPASWAWLVVAGGAAQRGSDVEWHRTLQHLDTTTTTITAPSIHPACWYMQTAVSLSGYVKYCAVIGVWSSICVFCSSCKLLSDSSASLALVLCATGFRATVLSHTKVGHWFNILSSLYQCQKWTISGSRFTQQSATHHFIVYFQYHKDVKRRQCNAILEVLEVLVLLWPGAWHDPSHFPVPTQPQHSSQCTRQPGLVPSLLSLLPVLGPATPPPVSQ